MAEKRNIPVVLGEKGDEAPTPRQQRGAGVRRGRAGMEQVARVCGHQEAPQLADLAGCNQAAPLCPSLTRNSIFAPPGTVFSPQTHPGSKHPAGARLCHPQRAVLSSSPFSGNFFCSSPHSLVFLLPLPVDPALEDSSCPCCPAGFPLPCSAELLTAGTVLGCHRTRVSARMQKRWRWRLIFLFCIMSGV